MKKRLLLPFVVVASLFFIHVQVNANSIPGGSDQKATIQQQEHILPILNQESVRSIKKEVKRNLALSAIRNLKPDFSNLPGASVSGDDDQLIAIILAIIFPPLGVAIWESGITSHFWISLILTFLFWLPGFIYSLIIILG